MEKKDPIIRPSANINVAAILEKANAIRQVLQHPLSLCFTHHPLYHLWLHRCIYLDFSLDSSHLDCTCRNLGGLLTLFSLITGFRWKR
jgi:hypothetical protein